MTWFWIAFWAYMAYAVAKDARASIQHYHSLTPFQRWLANQPEYVRERTEETANRLRPAYETEVRVRAFMGETQ